VCFRDISQELGSLIPHFSRSGFRVALGVALGAFWEPFGDLFGYLGTTWAPFGVPLGCLWVLWVFFPALFPTSRCLWSFWSVFMSICVSIGCLWGDLGSFWENS
jgi:hypothetical protein